MIFFAKNIIYNLFVLFLKYLVLFSLMSICLYISDYNFKLNLILKEIREVEKG